MILLKETDRKFINSVLLPKFGIRKVSIRYSPSLKEYPDIWVEKQKVPVITVTETWRRKPAKQRRIELVHEFLHLKGLEHGKIGKYNFSTFPKSDTYSKLIYKGIIDGM